MSDRGDPCVKAEEIADILRELEKHPRIATFSLGDLAVTFRDANPPPAPEPTTTPEVPETDDEAPDNLELPEGVFDPRKAIARVYAKALARGGAAS